ncbi:hypothetical protein [Streptomyces sp. PvR034]|uniref:hypothetical protein n=1 Tax=Streptomyces sp. PvR034 TaxID=3156401 RepID=UPI0033907C14
MAERGTLVPVGHAAEAGEAFPYGAFFGDQGRHGRTLTTCSPARTRPRTWAARRTWWRRAHWTRASPGGSWERAGDAGAGRLGRRLHGRAVLELT